MSKVKIGFSGLSVPNQIERARNIVTLMTGNASYTTPNPTLAVVTTAVDALETAFNQSRNRDKAKMVTMRLRRKEMLYQVVQLASYVQDASGGDPEKILSSGYSVAGAKTPHPVVPAEVTNVRLSDGAVSGSIRIDWDKAAYTVLYVILVSTEADFSKEDVMGITTKTRKEIGGFTSGTRYWIKVVPMGREERGQGNEPVSILVR
jgi:hypothetical protein